MFIATALFAFCVWWLRPVLGNHGLWVAFGLYMLARAGTLGMWWGKVSVLVQTGTRSPSHA